MEDYDTLIIGWLIIELAQGIGKIDIHLEQ